MKSKLHFYFHIYFFKLRDFFAPRRYILNEAEIRPEFYVVDYGCGPGSYILALTQMVGEKGRVYAVDSQPLAIRKVNDIISKRHLSNVESICSDCKTGLADNSIDVVLVYDTFHALSDSDRVLRELHRILKPNGILSFQDHRMPEDKIVYELTKGTFFQFLKQGKKTYTFKKINLRLPRPKGRGLLGLILSGQAPSAP